MMQNGLNLDAVLAALADALAEPVAVRVAERLAQADNGGAIRPRLLSIEQAAVYLGRTKEAMRHMISSGKIPSVRGDRCVALDVRDLDRWIEENKQAGIV